MKNILIIAGICFLSLQLRAQTIVDRHISFSGKKSIVLNIQIADSIRIIPWDKNEVYVWGSVNINNNKDNDLVKWTFDDSNPVLEITARLPGKEYWSENKKNCCCMESEIYCEVHIPENTEISVESISANLIISGKTSGIRAKTISGFIDIAISQDRKADLDFSTITGTVYTDFNLKTGNLHQSDNSNFSTSLNGGGNAINLETISGNIYLRKGN